MLACYPAQMLCLRSLPAALQRGDSLAFPWLSMWPPRSPSYWLPADFLADLQVPLCSAPLPAKGFVVSECLSVSCRCICAWPLWAVPVLTGLSMRARSFPTTVSWPPAEQHGRALESSVKCSILYFTISELRSFSALTAASSSVSVTR
jgi:hypothetical protein